MGLFDKLKELFSGPLPADPAKKGSAAVIAGSGSFDEARPIAETLDIPLSKLIHFAFREKNRYTSRSIPKKDGTLRPLAEPHPGLKFIQRRILTQILDRHAAKDCAHGFIRGCSIVTNATPHVNSDVVVGLDLRHFFTTITLSRIIGLFRSLGFNPKTAVLLAKLCAHEDVLPQGAPTSPAISNLVCRRLDSRLSAFAKKNGFNYTRYADDITFSGGDKVISALPFVRKVIAEESFEIAKEKTRVMRSGRRQKVTGLVVNDKVAVPRVTRKWLRAVVHRCLTKGARTVADPPENLRAILRGYAAFIKSVNPAQAAALSAQIDQINWE